MKYIELVDEEHSCQPRKFDAQRYRSAEIVEASYFQVHKYERMGIKKSQVFVFCDEDIIHGYLFCLSAKEKFYIFSLC